MSYVKKKTDQTRKFFSNFSNKEITGGVSHVVMYIVTTNSETSEQGGRSELMKRRVHT
jgi:hypothetical protein